MKNLEPKVFRQRLIIEGHYSKEVDGETLREYLNKLSKVMKMRIFAGPYSWPPDKWNKPAVKLYELNGFVAWTESGCHTYAWRFCKFFTCDIYSCKPFNVKSIVKFTRDFYKSKDIVYQEV